MKLFAFLLLALVAAVTAIPTGSSGDFDYTMERFGYGYTMELQGSGDYSSDYSDDYSNDSSAILATLLVNILVTSRVTTTMASLALEKLTLKLVLKATYITTKDKTLHFMCNPFDDQKKNNTGKI